MTECKTCNVQFTKHTNNQKNCPSCIRDGDKRRAGMRSTKPKTCKTCNTKYVPTGANQKYCSTECSDIRQYHIKRNYDLSLNQYNLLKTELGTDCMICGCKTKESSRGRDNLCIDHNHDTGKVRGFLCHHCNCAIGMFKDNTVRLQQAIQYLLQEKERAETIESIKMRVE